MSEEINASGIAHGLPNAIREPMMKLGLVGWM
jgi:hypothetical protein